MASGITGLSQELASAAERAGTSVVTVQGRHRAPSSGIHWRKGVVVTADHALRHEEGISIMAPDGKRIAARLAGRDAGTDLAALAIDQEAGLEVPAFADAPIKLANIVLALGRTRRGQLVASAGIIGGLGGEWRTWRGGRIDQSVRLDLSLYPGFSGGPLLNLDGKVVGVNTNGLSRGRAVTIPLSTVNRTIDELLEKGHVARPYLGLAMQPVAIPENLRSRLKKATTGGLVVLHVESNGPADKAGILLGDVIVELEGKPATDLDEIQEMLTSRQVNDELSVGVLRAGASADLSITLGERPTR